MPPGSLQAGLSDRSILIGRTQTNLPVAAGAVTWAMEIPTGHDRNADQIAYWNGPNGQRWTDRQAEQDVLLAPVTQVLIDRAAPRAGERIIDVGCGCGGTSSALATQVA